MSDIPPAIEEFEVYVDVTRTKEIYPPQTSKHHKQVAYHNNIYIYYYDF